MPGGNGSGVTMLSGSGAELTVKRSPLLTVCGVGEKESVTENVCVTLVSVADGMPLIVAVAALKVSPAGKRGATISDQV